MLSCNYPPQKTSSLPEHHSKKQIAGGCKCVLVKNYVFTADSDIFRFMFLIYPQIYLYRVCFSADLLLAKRYSSKCTDALKKGKKKKNQSVTYLKTKPTTPNRIILIFMHTIAIKLV